MNKILIALALLVVSVTAYAACSTHTIMSGGKIVSCTTCCDSFGNCTTTCFQENIMIISSLYKLAPPSQKEIEDRNAKIAKAIKAMGHKYLLSKSMPRIR